MIKKFILCHVLHTLMEVFSLVQHEANQISGVPFNNQDLTSVSKFHCYLCHHFLAIPKQTLFLIFETLCT